MAEIVGFTGEAPLIGRLSSVVSGLIGKEGERRKLPEAASDFEFLRIPLLKLSEKGFGGVLSVHFVGVSQQNKPSSPCFMGS